MSPHKPHSKKHKYPSKLKTKKGEKKLSDKPSHCHVSGKIETDFPPKLIEKYEANEQKTSEREGKKFRIELITLFFVFAAAIAASVQGYYSKKSADAAGNAAETAKNTLILDQRPWVGLMGSGHIRTELINKSPIRIGVDIQNVGRTPALDEMGVIHFSTHPIASPMPNFNDCSKSEASFPVTLMPNAISGFNVSTEKPGTAGFAVLLTEDEIKFIENGKVELFIYGCIWYNDTFKNPHRTDYCLQYVPLSKATGVSNTFAACPVHNYAD